MPQDAPPRASESGQQGLDRATARHLLTARLATGKAKKGRSTRQSFRRGLGGATALLTGLTWGCTATDPSGFQFDARPNSDAGPVAAQTNSERASTSVEALCPQGLCLANGTCSSGTDAGPCTCLSDSSALNCSPLESACSDSPCLNNGVCLDQPGSDLEGDAGTGNPPLDPAYICQCPPGFAGTHCAIDVNECEATPCANGARCLNRPGSFECECAPGFAGELCQEDIDDCSPNPCSNGGACTDAQNGFSCACPLGFAGEQCELAVTSCADAPCQNAATCTDAPPDIVCECPPGFAGRLCEQNIDECEQLQCFNGGLCRDAINSASCECLSGFDGEQCENNIDDCEQVNCLNGGQCLDGLATFVCSCSPGFSGEFCGTNIDDCTADSCSGNGVCVDRVEGFDCTCAPGFEGPRCQTASLQADGTLCGVGSDCQSGNCLPNNLAPGLLVCCSAGCLPSQGCQVNLGGSTSCVELTTAQSSGESCTVDNDCLSGQCLDFFPDGDNDGFAPAAALSERLCSDDSGSLPNRTTTPPGPGTVDCNDIDNRANPIATQPRPAGAGGDGSFDFNCDGLQEPFLETFDAAACAAAPPFQGCGSIPSGFEPSEAVPGCGQTGAEVSCVANGFGNCIGVASGAQLTQLCL